MTARRFGFGAGSLALILAVVNLAAFITVAAIGFMKHVTYPNVPIWFATGTDICFNVALILTPLSCIAGFFIRKKERAFVAAGIHFFTLMLMAFFLTKG
jgi:hypothetical protein